MYRQYENPYNLEKALEKVREEYRKAAEENADEETLISLHEDIEDLEERVNFAWVDDALICGL